MQRRKPMNRKSPLGGGAKQRRVDDGRAAEAADCLAPLLEGLGPWRFERYVRLGPLVVDFHCPAAKLAVLIGGEERAVWLEAQGYRLLALEAEAVVADPKNAAEAVAELFSLKLVR